MRHPLDPLTAEEFRQAAAVLRRDRGVGARWRFASMELWEPAKDVVRGWQPGDAIPREARVVVFDRDANAAFTARVSITDDAVLEWTPVPGEQPNMTVDEWHEAHEALIAHPRVVAALAARGITDLDLVLIDTWAYGHSLIPARFADRRVGWTDTWVRATPTGNPYAHPVNGLHFVIDLNSMELLDVEDTGSVTRPTGTMGEYAPGLVPGLVLRTDLRPVEVTQPEGVSFAFEGNELRWQNWSMRLGFTHREGLVLHRVGFDGRPIAHRMSFAEMVVPYRDPGEDHYRRTAFDIGEWGLGFMTTSLELGCDCLGEITYLDAVLHDSAGEPYTIANAICVHEEDDGVLWKHVDERAGAEVRRSRRLVVSFHATVANYEYLVYWRFHLDGSIQCEVRATGIMVTAHVEGDTVPPYGPLVDDHTYAPIHQHFIVARLDMEVDGPANTVVVSESEALPVSERNPYGLAVVQRERPVEREGGLDVDWASQRAWKVTSAERTNAWGRPTAYKLVPRAAVPAMADPSSPLVQRAGVVEHALWVTPYADDERWPAGEFCNQSRRDAGLPEWTKAGRSVVGTDLVLWHVFGIHHVPRPEDWPVMPVDIVSFELAPVGFFDRNPTLDVPPSRSAHCSPGPADPS
ncbi:primary-amine oxidase [Modestobacter sp. I12A-02628]|uniref:Amine oxidase n=1 Tax=Goekera deserti TaxID=2497753 RepID=A0A7K3WA00_9ACTN|nr:primary-amine oxidase [Goekera deserti]MPQ98868.1 primary-amine oxidase [Goekera deserti]NDI49633.1 primary-amine oxidase [Goekera deserti]NEL53174.1 primary-amine oxidase [Goekera deserti]